MLLAGDATGIAATGYASGYGSVSAADGSTGVSGAAGRDAPLSRSRYNNLAQGCLDLALEHHNLPLLLRLGKLNK